MRRVLLFLIAGACGGLAAWVVTEPFSWFHSWRGPGFDVNYTALWCLGALIGLGVGAALGAAEGWDRGSLGLAGTYGWMGGAAGLLGGYLGIDLGQGIFGPWASFNEGLRAQNLANPLSPALVPVAFLSDILARTVGWSLIGLLVGTSMGLLRYSPRRLKAGILGGWAGGALGGFSFEILRQIVSNGALCRAIGYTCIGAGTGLGVSLAQQIARQAWIRVAAGRNEGRDYLLEKEVNAVGRDEMSDVPLFGDPAVGKTHAYVKRVNGIWYLQDAGNSSGTQVNGQPVRERPLQEGDRIGIGRFLLEFHQRGGGAILVPDRDAAPASAFPAQAAASNVCAFCGTTKNPLTGACACTSLGSPATAGGPAGIGLTPGLAGAGAALSSFSLVAIAGPYMGQRFTISQKASIGRQEGNTLALTADPSISRRHAMLETGPGGLQIHDEGSSNGTYVNGARVTDATLRSGDEIQVGETRLRVG